MKKLLCVMLSVIMIFAFVGCGSEINIQENTTKQEITTMSTQQTTTQIEATLSPEEQYKDIFISSKIRWNMALSEVKDIEKRSLNSNLSNKDSQYLSYKSKESSYIDCVYCFSNEKLVAYWCEFKPKYTNDYLDLYNTIKSLVTDKYGACDQENINWTDSTYQNNNSKWNSAFKYGYVNIDTRWNINDDTQLIIRWDYNKGMQVITSESSNVINLFN